MGHYKANKRDLFFNIFEMPKYSEAFTATPFNDLDEDTAKSIIDEVTKLAENTIAETYFTSDKKLPIYDTETKTVTIPDEIKNTYQELMEAEWFRLDLPPELGGTNTPAVLRWAIAELLLGSNPVIYLYMAGPLFANILVAIGNEDQKKIAQYMVDQEWGATMVLTEPDAGSDVGAGRSTAELQPDGSWHIDGVKRFITSGEHDLSDNIIHLVLARPTNVEGEGGPGTKGLSLFLVPKYHINLETGELGERNGVYATNMEHKMGLKASATCELVFGQHGSPAVGYLVGDRHTGIKDMFLIIQWARMMVGTKSMAQLSAAYMTALDFAKTRVQGADLTQALDKTAPKVEIIEHPDVKRMLLMQKSYAEGLRALVMYTAYWQDQYRMIQEGELEGDADSIHKLIDLLLPIVKGGSSEKAAEMLQLSMQTLGGSGYLQDYAIELEIRDQAIDKLYEGVTHQQALDFLVRKILKNNLEPWNLLIKDIEETLDNGSEFFVEEKEMLRESLNNIQKMLEILAGWALGSMQEPKEIYKLGENANVFLLSATDLIVSWLLIKQAEVAKNVLTKNTEVSENDKFFYEGKIAAAEFFARNVLPKTSSDLVVLERNQTSTIMDVPLEAF
jgi:alkylation response protein AidB-like acyl-CoA dehydrogenase